MDEREINENLEVENSENVDKVEEMGPMDFEKENNEGVKNDEKLNESSEDDEKTRAEINEKSEYSDEVNKYMHSKEELEVYQNANLREVEINGRKCLISENIDMTQKDEAGRTNEERIKAGKSPIDKEGETVELHHVGQHHSSPFAELTFNQHRSKEVYSILHDTNKSESEIDRTQFEKEKNRHWLDRL